MCGIAGLHAPGGEVDRELVRAMTERLEHRGPDGDGFHFGPAVGLGARRLAIIDPAGGDQPLCNEAGDVAVVFNGELYNHAELRGELEAKGHRLRSRTDGEVIPHLFEEEGPAFVERLNGIFAIALWDERRGRLHLFRDHFGVKPLYWARVGGRLTFASELKALLLDPAIPRDLDPAAVDHFLTLRFVPSPMTPFAHVRKLAPASILTSDTGGVSETRFATDAPRGDRRDREQLIEDYTSTFERAVARQMMSDRPIGVMLSGGLDSAAVTAAMARHSSKVRAFTVGFSTGGDADEIADARRTADLFGAEHESVVISDREYLEALPRSLLTLDEPVSATSALAVNVVAELMRPTVPVALSGQGADEPLGGYGRHRWMKLAQALRRAPGVTALARRAPGSSRVGVDRALRTLGAEDGGQLLLRAYRGVVRDPLRARLYKAEFAREVSQGPGPAQAIEVLRRRVTQLDPLGQMLYVDTRFSLPDELLLLADKMSMAASVELRVPFLDRDLVGLIESAHSSQKVRRIHGRLQGKVLHKEAMRRLLPDEIVDRRKLGWETPVDRWLRSELLPLLREVLLGSDELCPSLFEERELRRLVDEHSAGRADHTLELFCLLSLGLWHRAFVSGGTPVAVPG